MTFTKGHSVKSLGRPKGSENKASAFVKEAVKNVLKKEPIDYILELMNGLNSNAAKLDYMLKLLPYMHPKLSNIEHSGSIDTGGDSETVEKLATMLKELKSG